MDDVMSNHEDVPRFVNSNLLRLLDTECISGVEDEDSSWEVLNRDDFNIFGIKARDRHHGLMELITCGKKDLWRDKEQIFSLDGIVPFFTNHLMLGQSISVYGSVQALTSGYPYALSSTYDWDNEPLLSMVHHSKGAWNGNYKEFSEVSMIVVELLQRIVFLFVERFGEVTFTVMALLDTLGRYVVEFDCELSRLYFLLLKLVIDSGIVDID
ncbi:hypothetical protein SUGI_1079840 [Cryptomeria japonica]|nr:hypothetical protein SUGI_1079840 [Cryptomeria japonica]